MSRPPTGSPLNRPHRLHGNARSHGNKVSKSASFHYNLLTQAGKPRYVPSKRTSYHEEESKLHSVIKQLGKKADHRSSVFYPTTPAEGHLEISRASHSDSLRINEFTLWPGVDKRNLKKLPLTKREVKRQESIYDFILKEKNSLIHLEILQKIYLRGMVRELDMDQTTINKLFPFIEDHIALSIQLVEQLKKRQSTSNIISGVGDILVDHFDEMNGDNMKRLYGELCSKENDILVFFKEMTKSDKKFNSFIKKCDRLNQSKRQDFVSCVQALTQRIYKIPSNIQALIDSCDPDDHNEDYLNLVKAVQLSTDLLNDVQSQVEVYRRNIILLDTHSRIDPRSSTTFKGTRKFDRKDLLKRSRKLLYSCNAQLSVHDRKKLVDIFLLILSDCIVFLEESNRKFLFLSGQSAVVPLQRMMVREEAGDPKGLYLISKSSEKLYQLKITSEEDCKRMVNVLKRAIGKGSDEDEGVTSGEEEERRIRDRRIDDSRRLIGQIEMTDRRIHKIYEEKMDLFHKLMDVVGRKSLTDRIHFYFPEEALLNPDWRNFKQSSQHPPLLQAVDQVNRFIHALYGTGRTARRSTSKNLNSRGSASRPGSVALKRSDTFGGFENTKPHPRVRTSNSSHDENYLGELKSSKNESRSLDSIPDESESSSVGTNRKKQFKQIVINLKAPSVGEEELRITPTSPFSTEHGIPSTPSLTAEHGNALVDLAQSLSVYQSFAAKQDSHIQWLKLQIMEEQMNYKKQLFGLQEAEIKRNQLILQEISDNLRREKKLFQSDKEEWEAGAEKLQDSVLQARKECEAEKISAVAEKEEISSQRKELEKMRQEIENLRKSLSLGKFEK